MIFQNNLAFWKLSISILIHLFTTKFRNTLLYWLITDPDTVSLAPHMFCRHSIIRHNVPHCCNDHIWTLTHPLPGKPKWNYLRSCKIDPQQWYLQLGIQLLSRRILGICVLVDRWDGWAKLPNCGQKGQWGLGKGIILLSLIVYLMNDGYKPLNRNKIIPMNPE